MAIGRKSGEEKSQSDELKDMRPGDFLIFKPKKEHVKLKGQRWFQRAWFAQTRGHESATHAAICVANAEGKTEIVHVTYKDGCIQEVIQDTKWKTNKWNIIAYRPEHKSLPDTFAAKAVEIASKTKDRPIWSIWMGLKAFFSFSWLRKTRIPSPKPKKIRVKTLCSSLMIQICKSVVQQENSAREDKRTQKQLKDWDPLLRQFYPDVNSASYPDVFEQWLDSNPKFFTKQSYLGHLNDHENSIYFEMKKSVEIELERIKSCSDGKYQRVNGIYHRVLVFLDEENKSEIKNHVKFSDRERAMYLLKYVGPALREKVNFTFIPSSMAKSFTKVMERAGDLGISQENVRSFNKKIPEDCLKAANNELRPTVPYCG